jgi:hypothetical protein
LVPGRGLEPPHLSIQVSETCASTNSAIWACLNYTGVYDLAEQCAEFYRK